MKFSSLFFVFVVVVVVVVVTTTATNLLLWSFHFHNLFVCVSVSLHYYWNITFFSLSLFFVVVVSELNNMLMYVFVWIVIQVFFSRLDIEIVVVVIVINTFNSYYVLNSIFPFFSNKISIWKRLDIKKTIVLYLRFLFVCFVNAIETPVDQSWKRTNSHTVISISLKKKRDFIYLIGLKYTKCFQQQISLLFKSF